MIWIYATMQYFAVAITSIGVMAWVGHLIGAPVLYTWARVNTAGAMSRPTATITILTGASLFILAQEAYKKASVRTVTRRRSDTRSRPRADGAGRGKRTS